MREFKRHSYLSASCDALVVEEDVSCRLWMTANTPETNHVKDAKKPIAYSTCQVTRERERVCVCVCVCVCVRVYARKTLNTTATKAQGQARTSDLNSSPNTPGQTDSQNGYNSQPQGGL